MNLPEPIMENTTKPETSYQERDEEQNNSVLDENDDQLSYLTSELKNHPINPIPPIPSLTLSLFQNLFDDRLTWSRKIVCISATLAINLFLPFINGIMLGFGEIAAREIFGKYLGWGPLKELYQTNQKNQIKNDLKEDELLPLEPSLQISTDQTRWWKPTNQTLSDQK